VLGLLVNRLEMLVGDGTLNANNLALAEQVIEKMTELQESSES
jgi:hypothetical protein